MNKGKSKTSDKSKSAVKEETKVGDLTPSIEEHAKLGRKEDDNDITDGSDEDSDENEDEDENED